jgi:hypothetical protein
MRRELLIKIPEDFAVLCTFWNTTPQQIVQYYLDHVSVSVSTKRLKVDPRKKTGFSEKELDILKNKLVCDPFGLATYFTIGFVSRRPGGVVL